MSRPMLAILLVLFFSAGGLMAWRTGLLDQITAAKAETLQVDHGLYGKLLAVDLEGKWGRYHVSITRGEDYPETAADVLELEKTAQTTAENAAIQCVAGGRNVFVQLLDEDGKVIASKEAFLASLLTQVDPIKVNLSGHSRARSLRLSMESGLPRK